MKEKVDVPPKVVNIKNENVDYDPELLEDLPELMGKTLFYWCKPKPCHGDVLAVLATLDSFKENREGGTW